MIWSHKTILTPLLIIEVAVLVQENHLSCICVFIIEVTVLVQESHLSCICVFIIEVTVLIQESHLSCICVLRISILPLSTILQLDIETLPTMWSFLVFIWSFRRVKVTWHVSLVELEIFTIPGFLWIRVAKP
jgi:hypothetical protein